MTAPARLVLAPTDAVLALGDSITDLAGPAGPWYVPAQTADIPTGFGPLLTAGGSGPGGVVVPTLIGGGGTWTYTPKTATLPTWVNSGVSGATTADLLANLATLVYAKTFTKLIIQAGVNDCLQYINATGSGTPAAFTQPAVDALLAALRSHYPTMPMLWLGPIAVGEKWVGWPPNANGTGVNGAFDPDLDARAAIIAALCASYGVTFADMRTPFFAREAIINLGNVNPPFTGSLTSDNVHPNTNGQRWVCDRLFTNYVTFSR